METKALGEGLLGQPVDPPDGVARLRLAAPPHHNLINFAPVHGVSVKGDNATRNALADVIEKTAEQPDGEQTNALDVGAGLRAFAKKGNLNQDGSII